MKNFFDGLRIYIVLYLITISLCLSAYYFDITWLMLAYYLQAMFMFNYAEKNEILF